MAERCAGCGAVGNYVQAGANCVHCLVCGEATEIATGRLLPKADKGALTSNDGHVVRELSTSTAAPEPVAVLAAAPATSGGIEAELEEARGHLLGEVG